MKKLLLIFFNSAIIITNCFGQAGDNDSTFNVFDDGSFGTASGFSSGVYAVTVQTDGKIIVGGSFGEYNDYATVDNLARLHEDGRIDTSFHTAQFGNMPYVYDIEVQPDGKIIVAGDFSMYNNEYHKRIFRLNTDGSLDASFNTGTGFGGTVYDVELIPGGKIAAVGSFSSYNGVGRNRIAIINSDGSLDTSFDPANGFNNTMYSVLVQPDGKIIAGGSFSAFNSNTAYKKILRLNSDGTIDNTFTAGTSFNSNVKTLALQPDGKIIVGGEFTSYNGSNNINYITRLETSGALDLTFTSGSAFNGIINVVKIGINGRIYAAGNFTSYNGTPKTGIVCLNTDASILTPFADVNTNSVNEIALQGDGKILVEGELRLMTDGTVDYSFNRGTGFVGIVNTHLVLPDDRIIVGGDFHLYNGIRSYGIICLYPDGDIDTTFNPGTGFDSRVNKLILQPDGKILVCGYFNTYNGNAAKHIVRLNTDGSMDNTFTTGTAFNTEVRTIALQVDGKILVGGDFVTYNGTSGLSKLIRLNGDGSIDNTFNTGVGFSGDGVDDNVHAIAIQPDGKILVGGTFDTYYGTSRRMITRLNTDGSNDTTFVTNYGFNITSRVNDIVLQPNGKMVVTGNFDTYQGASSKRIIRINEDGSIDGSFDCGTCFNSITYAAAIQPDGKIIVCGGSTYNGSTIKGIVRLYPNGTIDDTFNTLVGFSSPPKEISILQNKKIIATGNFNNHGEFWRNGIARLFGDPLSLVIDSIHHVTCSGSDGDITMSAANGIPPFEYTWNTVPPQDNNLLSGLDAGAYSLTVTDALGETATREILIGGPVDFSGFDLSGQFAATEFRTGFPAFIFANATNSGCLAVDTAYMVLVLDPLVEYQTAIPVPDSISGDTLIWNIIGTTYDSSSFASLVFVTTSLLSQIGDTVCIQLSMLPLSGDIDSTNNEFTMCYPVINSYDPNDKQVYPQGTGTEGYIANNQKMYYTVRFQNTGNASAINIHIDDPLDSDLDISTLRINGSSHPMTTELLPGNILRFNFENIYLPDSTSNEEESHGYVMYEIAQNPDLAPNTEIENTAYIYFDFNSAIVTNTVLNTIYDITTQLSENNVNSDILIYPIPTSNILTIETANGTGSYQLQDLTGKVLLSGLASGETKFSLDISALSKGIYLLSLIDGEQQVNRKVVKE